MTITETRPELVAETPAVVLGPPGGLAPAPGGIEGWITTVDHKRIGRLFVVFSLLFLVGGLVLGAVLGFDKVDPGSTTLDRDAVAQMDSLYHLGIVFLGGLPLLLGLAIAVVPLQVGAPRIAFPRAAAASFYGWLIGSGILIGAYIGNGGPGGGDAEAVDLFLVSFGLVLVSLLVAAVCVTATVLTMRPAGMRLEWVPTFAWATVVGSFMLLVTVPVMVANLVLLFVDHHWGRVVFGGNLGIPAYLSWITLPPQTLLYGILALGIIADVVATLAHRRLYVRRLLFVTIGLAGILSFGAYAQQAFAPDVTTDWVFTLQCVLAVLPALGVLVALGTTLMGGRLTLRSPLLWVLFAGLMALTAAFMTALFPVDGLELQGTTFQTSQLDYVILGQVLLAGLGGLVYWGPKLWGRRLPDGASSLLALLGLGGVVLVGLPMAIAGFLDQPSGQVSFAEEDATPILNALTAAGYALLALVVVALALLAIRGFARGAAAGDDPWDGQTLEWATTSPPPIHNFEFDQSPVASGEPLFDRKEVW